MYVYMCKCVNVGDELNNITEDNLKEILDYPCEIKYLNMHTYNNNISYRINDKTLRRNSDLCGGKISPFLPEKYVAKRTVVISRGRE